MKCVTFWVFEAKCRMPDPVDRVISEICRPTFVIAPVVN